MDLNKHPPIDGRLNVAFDDMDLSSSATSTSGSLEREARFSGTFFETTTPRSVETVNERALDDMQQPSSSNMDEQPLIVEQEANDEDSKKYRRENKVLVSVVKCIVSIFMSLTLFFCVVAGKISLVHIGQQLNYTAMHRNSTYIKESQATSLRETSFVMLIIIMIFPPFYSLVRAICVSGMKRSHPWPTKRAIIWVSELTLFLFIVCYLL